MQVNLLQHIIIIVLVSNIKEVKPHSGTCDDLSNVHKTQEERFGTSNTGL